MAEILETLVITRKYLTRLSAVLVAAGICVWWWLSPHPPPEISTSAFGVVRAASKDLAAQVAAELDVVYPKVGELLISVRDVPVEVWVVETVPGVSGDHRESLDGGSKEGGRIYLRQSARGHYGAVLAHELVHVLAGPAWSALPSVAEEGLAETVASVVCGEGQGSRRILFLATFLPGAAFRVAAQTPAGEMLATLSLNGVLHGNIAELLNYPGDLLEAIEDGLVDPSASYSIGTFIIDQVREHHGLATLYAQCVERAEQGDGRFSGMELLALAELGPDLGTWWPVLAQRLDEGHLAALATDNTALLARIIDELLGETQTVPERLDHLKGQRVSLSPVGGQAELQLSSSPAVVSALQDHWLGQGNAPMDGI